MLGAADLLREMQKAGASQIPEGIQFGTMIKHNACRLGDEIVLKPQQLYFFETSVMRYARTAKVQVWGKDGDTIEHEKEKIEDDRSIYMEPLKKGDVVALMKMPDQKYLVLGKIIKGEKVITLEDQIEEDWAEE